MSTATALRKSKPTEKAVEAITKLHCAAIVDEPGTISAFRYLPDAPPTARRIPEILLLQIRFDWLPREERFALVRQILLGMCCDVEHGSPLDAQFRGLADALENLVEDQLVADVDSVGEAFGSAAALHFKGEAARITQP